MSAEYCRSFSSNLKVGSVAAEEDTMQVDLLNAYPLEISPPPADTRSSSAAVPDNERNPLSECFPSNQSNDCDPHLQGTLNGQYDPEIVNGNGQGPFVNAALYHVPPNAAPAYLVLQQSCFDDSHAPPPVPLGYWSNLVIFVDPTPAAAEDHQNDDGLHNAMAQPKQQDLNVQRFAPSLPPPLLNRPNGHQAANNRVQPRKVTLESHLRRMSELTRSLPNRRRVYYRGADANHEQPPNRNLPSISQPHQIIVHNDGEDADVIQIDSDDEEEEALAVEDLAETDIIDDNQNGPEDDVNADQAAANFSIYLQQHVMNQPSDDRFFRACWQLGDFHCFDVQVVLNQPCCYYQIDFKVLHVDGSSSHLNSGWIKFPRAILLYTLRSRIQNGHLEIEAEMNPVQ